MINVVELLYVANNLPRLILGMPKLMAYEADVTLQKIEFEAEDNAPVATGALQSSGFRITGVADTFDAAVGDMMSAKPTAQSIDRPTVDTENGEAVVGFAADYAIFVHDGHHTTGGNYVPGIPFLAQAVEAHSQELVDNLAASIERYAGGGTL